MEDANVSEGSSSSAKCFVIYELYESLAKHQHSLIKTAGRVGRGSYIPSSTASLLGMLSAGRRRLHWSRCVCVLFFCSQPSSALHAQRMLKVLHLVFLHTTKVWPWTGAAWQKPHDVSSKMFLLQEDDSHNTLLASNFSMSDLSFPVRKPLTRRPVYGPLDWSDRLLRPEFEPEVLPTSTLRKVRKDQSFSSKHAEARYGFW